MRCGETHIRSEEYDNNYSDELFFKKLIKTDNPVIIDIGAHVGESVKFFYNIFEKCRIYSFEPSPKSFEELTTLNYKNFYPINKAVSSETGKKIFYEYDLSHLNSMNKINRKSYDSIDYARNANPNQIEIKSVTLDSFIKEHNFDLIDIIKIDVQGSEKDVLSGATNCLLKTKLITVEIGFFDFYEKNSSFLEIESLLPHFELYSIIRLSQNPMNFRTDWCEAVYINKSI